VKRIFELYLELGCVSKLKERLNREGFKSKVRTNHSGQKTGGKSYARGALHCLLQNPIYIGKIRHRDTIYEGEHEAIIPQQLWERVQERLKTNGINRQTGRNTKSPSLLVGLIYDAQDNRLPLSIPTSEESDTAIASLTKRSAERSEGRIRSHSNPG
jgi:hypothetical protein